MNITETVMLAREGDADAISILYSEYKNSIYYICRQLMGNEKDAGIVLQYTFFQAFHKLAVLKNPENFGMWLYIIAVNRCRILLRDKKPTLFAQPDEKDKASKIKFSLKNNKEITSADEVDPKLRDAVMMTANELPYILRITVILYFYCRMSLTQIAKIFEYDESVIKLQLIQAASLFKTQITAKSRDFEQLIEYSNIENIGVIFEYEVRSILVPNELSENIVATSVTLAASAAGSTYLEEKDKSQVKIAAAENETNEKDPPEKIPLTAEQRTALRNVITIGIVLILAVSIIIGSIIVIKKAADSIAMSTGVSTESQTTPSDDGTKPISSEDVTDEPITEPETETTTSPPAVTEAPVTTPVVTDPPVTDPPVTKPPETQPPVTEAPAVTEDQSILFESDVVGKEVTISKYTGTAKEVDVPSSVGGKPVTKIAAYAFQDNTKLISVKIPASVKTIGAASFRGCTSLTTVTFSSGLTAISDYAFLECAKLSTFKIPSTVTSIGVSAFGSTAWISAQKTSFLTAGDGILIKYLGTDSAVTVPSGVKYISNAFYYKNGVTSVILPSGVTTIGTYAFCKSPNLKSITLPDTITLINTDAIYECSSLAEIKVKSGSYAETWCKNNGFTALLVTY
ncbi:MAG: leucine-rich repeat protein [Eubacteriales bacterium]